MSRVLNISYSLVLNLRCKDVSNSFKVYRADWLKRLSLRCANFDIVEEILFKLVRQHPRARIKEVPFSFKKRMFGETKRNLVTFMLTYLFTIIRLRLRTD
jgi:dolichol-phosphate mannosyltransferase